MNNTTETKSKPQPCLPEYKKKTLEKVNHGFNLALCCISIAGGATGFVHPGIAAGAATRAFCSSVSIAVISDNSVKPQNKKVLYCCCTFLLLSCQCPDILIRSQFVESPNRQYTDHPVLPTIDN